MRAELDALRAEAAARATIRREVTTGAVALAFATDDPAVLDWPLRYLVPTYGFGEEVGVDRPEVTVVRSAELHERARKLAERLAPGEDATTYEGQRARRHRADADAMALAYVERPGVTIVDRGAGAVLFVTAEGDGEAPFEAARLIREVLTKALEERGRFVLHAGAVSVEGAGCVLCGPKLAGKTTLVVALMEALGADFVANDRIYVGPDDGRLGLLAWPMSVRIGIGTCLGSARLRHVMRPGGRLAYPQTGWDPAAGIDDAGARLLAASARGPKVELIPSELVEALGTAVVSGAPLSIVVLPRRDPDGPAAKLAPVAEDEAVAELSGQLLTPEDDAYPDWLGLRRRPHEGLAADAKRLVREMVRAVPVVRLSFSDAMQAASLLGARLRRSDQAPPDGGMGVSTGVTDVV